MIRCDTRHVFITNQISDKYFQILFVFIHLYTLTTVPIYAASEYVNAIAQLTNEKAALELSGAALTESSRLLTSEKEQLAQLVEQLELANVDLAERARQTETRQQDYLQLLSQLQSAQTGLSRASAQNKQLKAQLAELQEAFVKLVSAARDTHTHNH